MNEKFFIYKVSIQEDEKPDLSFIPMLIRRKLSQLSKIAFSTIYNCYENEDVNLIFASRYGEFEKLGVLMNQYKNENEVSPLSFSSSVHNATIGNFSLINNIKSKYNAISAGENTISNGFLEALTEQEKTLFCYADTIPNIKSFACLLGKEFSSNADEVELVLVSNEIKDNEFERFVKFLNKEKDEFVAPYYTLRRVK